jgi:hypothetical protein
MIFKMSNLLMGLMFALSALLQLNDPDTTIWIVMYISCAACCLLVFTNVNIVYACLMLALVSLLWGTGLFSDLLLNPTPIDWNEVMTASSMKSAQTELTREIGGLLICFIWMLYLAWMYRTKMA